MTDKPTKESLVTKAARATQKVLLMHDIETTREEIRNLQSRLHREEEHLLDVLKRLREVCDHPDDKLVVTETAEHDYDGEEYYVMSITRVVTCGDCGELISKNINWDTAYDDM